MRAMDMPSEEMQKGHRRRLREKFLKSGLSGFHDYEIVELLLTLGSPRRDCKPQAKEAIKRFKTLRGVLSASAEELQQIEGVGPHSAFGIRLIQEMAREFLKGKIVDQPFLKSSREIFDYLYHTIVDAISPSGIGMAPSNVIVAPLTRTRIRNASKAKRFSSNEKLERFSFASSQNLLTPCI
jgi:DNA repair protein RadC